MNTAEWIIMIILACTLFIFLVLGIILMVKVMRLVRDAQNFVDKGHEIADKASGVANNLYEMTLVGSISGLAKRVKKQYNKYKQEAEKE